MSQSNGPPSLIWFLNLGMTDPDDSKTFPKRTIEKLVLIS